MNPVSVEDGEYLENEMKKKRKDENSKKMAGFIKKS